MYEPILLYLWLLLNYDIHQFFHSMVFDVLIQIALSYFLSTLIRVFQRFWSGNAPFLLPLFLQDFLSGRGSARSNNPLYLFNFGRRTSPIGEGKSYVISSVSGMVLILHPPFCSPFKVSVAAFDDGRVGSPRYNSINGGLMSGLSISQMTTFYSFLVHLRIFFLLI